MLVYISGPLMANQGNLKFYEAIAKLCLELNLEPYLPHIHTASPSEEADARAVFSLNFESIAKCALVIADVTAPSHGVGGEIMEAHVLKKPVICVAKAGATVSRMVRGNPAVKAILFYDSDEDAINRLRQYLCKILPP